MGIRGNIKDGGICVGYEIGTIFMWLMEHLIVLNIILTIVIIFFERREPQTVWTWLLVLYFIPVLGFPLYLIVGQNYRKTQMFRMKEIEDEVNSAVVHQESMLWEKDSRLISYDMQRFQNLIIYNLQTSSAVLTDNNDIRIYTDGEDKFQALLHEIEQAKKYIHLQYYILRDDDLWQRIQEALKKKAKQGVEIRILIDGMGSREITHKKQRELRKAGIEVAEFFPAIFGKLHLRVNYRNHRKIAVIDGRVGFVGGFNVGNEYLGKEKKFGYWRDTHLCIEGAAVTSLAVRFVLDWNYATKDNLFLENQLFEVPNYFRGGQEPVQIISSGPDSASQYIRDNYMRLIHKARERVYIQTPYFVPDEAILEALKVAAQSGIDVRVMIPCKPDHMFVYWATYSYIGELIEAGAKCYVYNNGFLHAKVLTVDGLVTCCGTANMDIRSFKLNFEVNAVIYGEKTTLAMERKFINDISYSTQVTKKIYRERSVYIRFKEQFSRLLSPLL